MALFKKKTKEERVQEFIEKFRKENIPPQYNQAKGVEILWSEKVHTCISISSRTDGKTFNFIGMLMALAIEFPEYGLNICFLDRHYTLRQTYIDLIWDIMDIMSYFDVEKVDFERGDLYTNVEYDGKVFAIITDINKSQDLKNASAFLKKFPVEVYDEFITLPQDYVPNEGYHLSKIYYSINRDHNRPFLKKPKQFYLGNPENFESPVFSMYDLYNDLETHPINTAKIYHEKVWLEMWRNENQNDLIGESPFVNEVGNATSGQFTINNTHIANNNIRTRIENNGFNYFNVKLEEGYLFIKYNIKTKETLVSYKALADDYDYCTDIKDVKNGVIYLKENYYKETHWKYHEKGRYWYDNSYTKTLIVDNPQLIQLKLWRLVSEHKVRQSEMNNLPEKQFKEISEKEQLRKIQQKFFMG